MTDRDNLIADLSAFVGMRTQCDAAIVRLNAQLATPLPPVDPVKPPVILPTNPGSYLAFPPQLMSPIVPLGIYLGPVLDQSAAIMISLTNENTDPGMVYVPCISTDPNNFTNPAPWPTSSQGSGGGFVGLKPKYAYPTKIVPAGVPWYLQIKALSGDASKGIVFTWGYKPYP